MRISAGIYLARMASLWPAWDYDCWDRRLSPCSVSGSAAAKSPHGVLTLCRAHWFASKTPRLYSGGQAGVCSLFSKSWNPPSRPNRQLGTPVSVVCVVPDGLSSFSGSSVRWLVGWHHKFLSSTRFPALEHTNLSFAGTLWISASPWCPRSPLA